MSNHWMAEHISNTFTLARILLKEHLDRIMPSAIIGIIAGYTYYSPLLPRIFFTERSYCIAEAFEDNCQVWKIIYDGWLHKLEIQSPCKVKASLDVFKLDVWQLIFEGNDFRFECLLHDLGCKLSTGLVDVGVQRNRVKRMAPLLLRAFYDREIEACAMRESCINGRQN